MEPHPTFFVIAAVSLAMTAEARPVAYLGGWSIMNENRTHQTRVMMNYSFERNVSVGKHASLYRAEEGELLFGAPTLTALLLRANEDGRQSNIYLGGGYGLLRAKPYSRCGNSGGYSTSPRFL